jgi:hypothetical protein
MLLLRFFGLFLLRFNERRLFGLLFQKLPRSTRPQSGPSPMEYYLGKDTFAQAQGLRLFGMTYPALLLKVISTHPNRLLPISECQTVKPAA